jgi:hypothetical protein
MPLFVLCCVLSKDLNRRLSFKKKKEELRRGKLLSQLPSFKQTISAETIDFANLTHKNTHLKERTKTDAEQ